MVAIFDSNDERSHTILVFRRNEKEGEGMYVGQDEGYDERYVGAKKIEKGTHLFLRCLGVKLGREVDLSC